MKSATELMATIETASSELVAREAAAREYLQSRSGFLKLLNWFGFSVSQNVRYKYDKIAVSFWSSFLEAKTEEAIVITPPEDSDHIFANPC